MPQQDLFTNIFGVPSPNGNGILQEVTHDFPYFSIAQFYLLKETDPGNTDYNKIAGRTALHFNDPFYLNYLLSKKNSQHEMAETIREPVVMHTIETNPVTTPHQDTNTPGEAKEDTQAEAMIFEPLYTTDYFASQGIKLSDEIKADDKLGKQLKSFTDWLKTMKKVHDQRLPAGNEQLDMAVQNIAEKSNKEADIITESMAEVYISQGKLSKGKEIYQKLSLLNPSKSAYFAAKIELLKDK